ncbi:MAG: FAD-dependent oxidoreductase [Woeseiaceae bacterium]|nr:FAD-dependent oxidoreductase [Woeseiaceae bacterium]
MSQSVVIVGAGHGAGQVVASLKQHSFVGRIVLVGEEPYLPYQRPPLSKKYLAGEMLPERLYFKPASFYADDNIDIMLDTRVERIDRDLHEVSTSGGQSIAYDKLVIATGSRVRSVGVPGADLAGIHYLRSIGDVDAIRNDIENAASIVIVGAGYIGLEVAAVCRQAGLRVTVVEMAERVMSRVVSEQVSAFYEQLHASHGVDIRLSTGIAAFKGAGRLTHVVTSTDERIAADMAVIGVGITPNTGLAEDAGLSVDNGIVVDDRCQTEDPDIYAIGDCTSHPNSIYDRRLRLESVHNALEQAKTAAANICGIETHYAQVPWFWSDQYDVKLQIAGLSQGYDETVLRGNPADAGFVCFYLRNGTLIAVDAINSPREFMQSKPLIANHASIEAGVLADKEVLLRDLA